MDPQSAEWPTRMNATDALFWAMDKIPDMRSTIGALVILDRVPSRERLREEFDRLSTSIVRMRQRVVEVPLAVAPPEWVEDTQFDLDYHLRQIAVPGPGGMAEVLEEMGPLYATAFDRDRPLWEAYVADGLLGGQGAIFVKMHHCLVDGVGGSRMFETLLGQHPAPPAAVRLIEMRSTTPAALLWRAALYNVQEAVEGAGALVQSLAAAALNPVQTVTDVGSALRMLTGLGRELSVSRADSPLHQARSLSRRLSTFEMSLTEIDAVRQRLGATNNDVVLTIVSGAMHRWHTSRGADVHALRAMVPVNIRATEDTNAGNRIGLLAVGLPVGEPNPLQRLRTIQQHMGQIKHDRRARLYPWLARVMIALPTAVARSVSQQQTSRTNFVCTNVPGPRHTCYLGGATIEKIYPYAPLVGDHPVAIALYSYRDTLCVGLDVDPMAMKDLAHFRDALQESYEEVLNISRQTAVKPVRAKARRPRRATA